MKQLIITKMMWTQNELLSNKNIIKCTVWWLWCAWSLQQNSIRNYFHSLHNLIRFEICLCSILIEKYAFQELEKPSKISNIYKKLEWRMFWIQLKMMLLSILKNLGTLGSVIKVSGKNPFQINYLWYENEIFNIDLKFNNKHHLWFTDALIFHMQISLNFLMNAWSLLIVH